jgi:peroxiredoxin
MKKLILAMLLPVIGVAQQKGFTIQGTAPAAKNGCKVYLNYQTDDKVIMDSTAVTNGKFSFKGSVSDLSYGRMVFDHENKGSYWVMNLGDHIYFYIANENYKIAIKDSLERATISGSATHKTYAAYLKQINGGFMNIIDSARREMNTAYEKGDTNLQKAIKVKYDNKFEAMRVNEIKYIKANPASYYSIISLVDVSNARPLSEVETLYNGLDPKIQETTSGKELKARFVAARTIQVGKQAPEFEQPDVNGKMVKLSDFRGRYVLVDFWASWCHPCRDENPNLVKAYAVYKDKGLEVLGVSLDDTQTRNAWIKAIEKDGLPWIHVSDLKGWQNQVAVLYGIRAVPQNYLIDPQGKIIAQNLRGEDLTTKLGNYIH